MFQMIVRGSINEPCRAKKYRKHGEYIYTFSLGPNCGATHSFLRSMFIKSGCDKGRDGQPRLTIDPPCAHIGIDSVDLHVSIVSPDEV